MGRHVRGGLSYQFEIKGLKGEALKSVLAITLPRHKQPVDSELASHILLFGGAD
jgi:hypothetical protein